MSRHLLACASVLTIAGFCSANRINASDTGDVIRNTRASVQWRINPLDLLQKQPTLAMTIQLRIESPEHFTLESKATLKTRRCPEHMLPSLSPPTSSERTEGSATDTSPDTVSLTAGKVHVELRHNTSIAADGTLDLPSQLMEEPRFLVCGVDRPGPEVWYVNGILTSCESAHDAGEMISKHLNRRVHLLHNATIVEPPFQTGLTIAGVRTEDLTESTYDRAWPAIVAGRILAESLSIKPQGSLTRLQGNPTTRQLTWVLYHSKRPVSLITHSQGCLIARNAFLAMALLGRESRVRHDVAWVAAGIPFHDQELSLRPDRTTILDFRNDPVPKWIGLRGGGLPINPSDHWIQSYVKQLTNEQLEAE